MLPIGDKLIEYDTIAVNTIVANSQGEVSSCDIPFSNDLSVFNANYIRLTRQVAKTCESRPRGQYGYRYIRIGAVRHRRCCRNV